MWEVAVFLAVIVGCGYLVIWLRRKYHPKSHRAVPGNWTIEQIEGIYKAGQISDQEFKVLRRQVLSPGFTLIELIVSVSIMVIMILIFGTIIGQTQKVVSGSQATMRSNNTVRAIAHVIRTDLRKLTKSGFLCITHKYDNSTNTYYPTPVLIFATAGLTQSKTDSVTGLGGVSVYGHCDNSSTGDSGNPLAAIFLRQSWVLNPMGTGADIWPIDLAVLQTLPRTHVTDPNINDLVNRLRELTGNLSVPPENLSDIANLWQVLSSESDKISIMWTDGTTDAGGNLNWYGIDYDNAADINIDRPKDGDWTTRDITSGEIEFDNNGYRALWTRHNQNNWPKAIKIKFELNGALVWDNSTTYNTGDYAVRGGNYYRSIQKDNTNHEPPNATWWEKVKSQGMWYEVIASVN